MRTDGQLVQQTLKGDSKAFGELVDRYRNMAYGLAYHLTGEFEAARDLAQESFIQAYLKLAQLHEAEKFAGWLRRIVLNLHRMQRRRQEVVTVALEEEMDSASQLPQPSEIEAVVQEALGKLRNQDRLTLTLHYIDGYSYTDIAGFLAVNPETIKTRLARARQHLKKEIMNMVEDAFQKEQLPEDFTAKTVSEALRRGQEALYEDDYEKALDAFGQAIALQPESAEAHAGLGEVYVMKSQQNSDQDKSAKARTEFEEALRHDPRNEAALIGLAEMEPDKRRAYEKALSILPESVEMRYQLAWLIYDSGDTEQAVQMMTAMLDSDIPDVVKVRIHNNLGCIYHDRLGDLARGREHLLLSAEAATNAKVKPSSFFHWRVYAWVALCDHQWQEALAAATHMLDTAPTDFERRNLHVLLAAAKANLHQIEDALQHLEAAMIEEKEPSVAGRWPITQSASADPLEWVRNNRDEYFSTLLSDLRFRKFVGDEA